MVFDAVYVPGGAEAGAWVQEADAVDFVRDAYKHCKAIAATGEGRNLLEAAAVPVGEPGSADPADDATLLGPRMTAALAKRVVTAMAGHRLWTREPELHLDP